MLGGDGSLLELWLALPGMAVPSLPLDKARFVQRLPRLALRIPKQHSHRVASLLSHYLLDMPRVKHIVPDPLHPSMRLLLLSPAIAAPGLQGLPEDKKLAVSDIAPLDVVQHEVVLDYSYWPVGIFSGSLTNHLFPIAWTL